MPDPAGIIKSHREYLIRRIVSRNSLLRFKPSDRSRQLDVCKIFPEPQLLQSAHQHNSCDTPDEFLRRIFIEDSVKSDINQNTGIATRLRKLQNIADDNKRTVGQQTLILAWPFLHIPVKFIDGTNKPLFAPLFLWRINISNVGIGHASFSLVKDNDDAGNSECELNFVLAEYLKAKAAFQLPNEENVLSTMQESGSVSIKTEAIKKWLSDNNQSIENINDFGSDIRPYSDPAAHEPTLISVAALGNAHFNYLSLFRDLEELEKKARAGKDLGLLSLVLGKNHTAKSADIEAPDEKDQWLVETSDPSQEKVVWKSGSDNEPIILLEGPPGSGKSQTIVNIVAAALQQKKKNAVVCHHIAALNVVRKRLENIGLGEMVAQITAPKANRYAVIKKARDIHDARILTRDRNAICSAIESNERICDKRSNAFSPNPYKAHKTRGHFLAKIDAAKRNTGFDAHLTLNAPFIEETVGEWLGSNPHDEHAILDEVENIAERWQEHDYPNHSWKGIGIGWDNTKAPSLQADFSEIIRKIASLDSEYVPVQGALPYATHPLVNAYYSQITDAMRHDVVALFSDIVKATRAVFDLASFQPCPPLWTLLYQHEEAVQTYSKYRDTIADIPDIVNIERAIKNNNVIQDLSEKFTAMPEHWHEIVEAAVCKLHWSRLPSGPVIGDYKRAKDRLKIAVQKKKKANVEQLINSHTGRKHVRNELHRGGRLRLRGGQRPATKLRELYHYETDAGQPIWDIFPVLLTNPGSVSQIMPLNLGSIDLLVVDEASQMFTADAMPLLYRSKRAVISGDEHQMPPSNFFALSDDQYDGDSGYDDEQEDIPPDVPYELLEAITQFASTASSLGVHYRSRSAELIAFSNHAFYKGKLQTAPYNISPLNFRDGRAVSVESVNGDFSNGTNKQEVDAIVEMLQEIWGADPNLSVGIIVFNTRQRDLVLTELVEKSGRDENFRNIHDHFSGLKQNGEDVGLFVRSVEHVQGDERDIIILGTTYGRDRRNYGPIGTRELGRRRLNVAVTRAKFCMVVITSLNIHNIANEGDRPDVGDDQTGAERWYLWKYLQYAQAVSDGNSKQATDILRDINPDDSQSPTGEEPENEFERQVGEFLREHGFHIDYQVGESGFRIDIGIKRTKDDSTYLCGVECDGRTYHAGWRARQNDIWRQEILEEKGWRIERIWSDEWFSRSDRARHEFREKVQNDTAITH